MVPLSLLHAKVRLPWSTLTHPFQQKMRETVMLTGIPCYSSFAEEMTASAGLLIKDVSF